MKRSNTKTAIISMLFLFSSIQLMNTGCSKDDNDNLDQSTNNTATNVVKQNVKVIKPEDASLVSNSTDLSQGIYKFDFSKTPDTYAINDIIVGKEGYGFLRKVTSISYSGNTVTFETKQAALSDVFSKANYAIETADFQGGISKVKSLGKGVSMLKSASPNSFYYDFSNTILYEGSGFLVKITTGTISNTTDYEYSVGIDPSGVIETKMITTNVFDIRCIVKIVGSGDVSLADINKELANVEHVFTFEIAGVPLVFVIDTKCDLQYKANIGGDIDITSDLSQTYTSRIGAIFANGQWTDVNETTPTFSQNPIELKSKASVSEKLTIVPSIAFKFYGIAGFTFTPTLWGTFDFNYANMANLGIQQSNWDALLQAGVNLNIGVVATTLGQDYEENWDVYTQQWDLWSAPYLLSKVSGDNQTGVINQQLTDPIRVMATDNWNNPLPGVVVYYNVTQGDGNVSNAVAITDTAGYATTNWIMGNTAGAQEVTVKIQKADGSNISGSPQIFNATSVNQ